MVATQRVHTPHQLAHTTCVATIMTQRMHMLGIAAHTTFTGMVAATMARAKRKVWRTEVRRMYTTMVTARTGGAALERSAP